MKKIKTLFILILSLSFVFYSCSSDDDETIKKSSEKAIKAFTANDQTGIINEEAKTISLTFPFGSDVTKVKPTINVSEKATVSPASDTEVNMTLPITYVVTAEDGSTQNYTLITTVAKNSAADILTFVFNELNPKVTATIDIEAKTVIAEVPYGTNVTALKPTITISGETISPVSGVAQDFTNPVKYSVTAANGDKKEFTVTVKQGEMTPEIIDLDKNSMKMDESITLTGKFLKAGNIVEFRNFEGTIKQKLEITNETESSITAKLTADIAEGEYIVYVICGSKGVSADPKRVAVTKSTDPKIISLNKTKYIQGLDKITITGTNFKGTDLKVYIKTTGASDPYLIGKFAYATNNNTIISLENRDDIKVGKQVVYVVADGVKSNEFSFEVIENTNPVPTITSINPETPSQDQEITITGTNLGDIFDAQVLIYSYNKTGTFMLWIDQQILSGNANTIKFKLPTLVDSRFKVQVRVKGKLSEITTKEYTSTK